jgi:hypothetical protein
MHAMIHRRQRILGLVAALAVMAIGTTAAFAQQASITLKNCNIELCYANNTAWELSKSSGTVTTPVTAPDQHTITWTVTATRGDTTDNFLNVNGYIEIANTGTAPATIGNIVVNLQRKVGTKWVSAAADCADATNGDNATACNIVAAASQEVDNSFNYMTSVVTGSGTQGKRIWKLSEFSVKVIE